jgi:DNA-binding transcriptional regulator YiaG
MKSYKEKRQEFSPEAQARISVCAQEIRNEIRILRAIREASGLSQEELADISGGKVLGDFEASP